MNKRNNFPTARLATQIVLDSDYDNPISVSVCVWVCVWEYIYNLKVCEKSLFHCIQYSMATGTCVICKFFPSRLYHNNIKF